MDGMDYGERSAQYCARSISRILNTIKTKIEQPYSVQNVNEVRVAAEELTHDYEHFKKCMNYAFTLIDTADKDAAKKQEELVLTDLENVKSKVLSCQARVRTYVQEFEAKSRRESLSNSTVSQSINNTESSIRLPKINVPKFDGNVANFLEFYAIFQNMIHEEPSIPKIRKLCYLKDSLTGDAAELIADTPLTERGYDEAWCLVQSTYKDVKSITRKHFDQLFGLQRIKSQNDLPNLLSKINRAVNGLRACGESTENWGSILCYLISEKLDEQTYVDFERSLTTNTKFPSWKELRPFLENRASVTKRNKPEQIKPPPPTERRNESHKQSQVTRNKSFVTTESLTANGGKPPNQDSPPPSPNKKPICVCCNQSHLLIDCKAFTDMSPKQRFECLDSKPICKNCFQSNHKTAECRKPPKCRYCNKRHHSLLHFDSKVSESSPPKPEESLVSTVACASEYVSPNPSSSFVAVQKPIVLLPTAVVKFATRNQTGEMRVLLDSCSQVNLINESFVSRYKLATFNSQYVCKVSGVNNIEQVCNKVVNLTLESRTQSFRFNTSFNVISTKLPYSISNVQADHIATDLSRWKLADPAYYQSPINIPEIDALLGIEAYDRIVRGEVLRIGALTLRNTEFGWTLTSVVNSHIPRRNKPENSTCCLTIDSIDPTERIDRRLKLFWETESPESSVIETSETSKCNAHFEQTYTRNENGIFVVRLPFKSDPTCITNNYGRAASFLKRMERNRNPVTASAYSDFMQEYIDMKHMSIVPTNSDVSTRYFIPHHAVLKPESTTTKLRVVFNASFGSDKKKSLNDVLMIGPVLQPELFDTLIRFRTYEYVVTGDVAKMYRCILIHPADRKYQSILWNDAVYELNTVTYGTASASYQATKCLQMLADEVEREEPDAAAAIRHNFYMDDFIAGANTVADTIRLQRAVHRILNTAGFNLRKYQSNSPGVLSEIDPNLIEAKLGKSFGGDLALSVLGLTWMPTLDKFQPKADLHNVTTDVTKRIMLSTICKLFDPLGLVAPVLIRGKLMLQQLWRLQLPWDEPVTAEVAADFRTYVNDLMELKRFSCPRYVGFNENSQLFGFSDASEKAYCAAIYVFDDSTDPSRLTLLCSKTRVAPIKSLTIPQLELQAAVLLVELTNRINRILNLNTANIHLYTDSKIVLAWLARPASDWKIFVRNRVSKIAASFPIDHWKHVRSGDNPADLATRGLSTEMLMKSIWLNGPNLLPDDNESMIEFDQSLCKPYLSKPKAVTLTITEDEDRKLIHSCSSYLKLLRIVAVAKIIAQRKSFVCKHPVLITAIEIKFAELYILRIVQRYEFPDDYQRLIDNRKLRKRSCLRSWKPFIDEDGLIRSDSRLKFANLPFERKCPILLPAKGHYASIFIAYLHEKFFHANRAFLLAHLSTKFAFIGGIARTIKNVLYNCVTCRRYSQKSKPQQMANLPADRVNPRSPFEVVGVDFTGAFNVKCNHHRVVKYAKTYAAIFVCMVTRAVHIEIVPSLSSEDFLSALKCFCSRRGLPRTIYSDNGTNFKGAERYLNFHDSEIVTYSSKNQIDWNFNPPYTPHRGGIWESAVKSAKRFIPIVTKGQSFSENELRVLLTQVECLLNSRPIAYRKTSVPEEEVLTPGHFLIGRNLTTVPEPSEPTPIRVSAVYRANCQRLRDFWRLWSTDYLNQLRCRSKWLDVQPNPTVGQIVLYKDSNRIPAQWPLARIVRCFPDPNDIVRTVEISVNGQIRRIPTIQIIPLPIDP